MHSTTYRVIQPALVLGIFAVDRLSKYWAQSQLQPKGAIQILPFFHLTYLENTGAAWGIFQGFNTFLIVVSLVLLGMLFYLKRRWPKQCFWSQLGMVLIAGGALGNLYDRITLGYVVDFLDFRIWPVFNVADSCITVGAIGLAWGLHRKEKQA